MVANLATILLAFLLYYNYVLFQSYLSIILYAYLMSEALWDTKCSLVAFLEYINSDEVPSPRKAIKRYLMPTSIRSALIAAALSMPLLYRWPLKFTVTLLIVILVYILDRWIFYLTRLHRLIFNDHSVVALLIIAFILVGGGILLVSFALLSFKDAISALDAVQSWVDENLIQNGTFQDEFWKQAAGFNVTLKSALANFESQYNQTAVAPVVHAIVESFEQEPSSTRSFFFSFEDWASNMTIAESLQYAQELYQSQAELINHGKMWALSVSERAFVLLAGALDAGTRLIFFISFLLVLLSAEQNIMHALIMNKSKEKRVRAGIAGIFLLPVKLSIVKAVMTLALFTILNVNFMFVAASLTFTVSLFPILYAYIVVVPWSLVLIANGNIWRGSTLFLLTLISFEIIDSWVLSSFQERAFHAGARASYKEYITSLKYVLSLSIFFGVSTLGWHGIVAGPILISTTLYAVAPIVSFLRSYENTADCAQSKAKKRRRSTDRLNK